MIHAGCFCGQVTLRVDYGNIPPGTLTGLQVRCTNCPEDPWPPAAPLENSDEPAAPIDGQLRLHELLTNIENDLNQLWARRLAARKTWWRHE